MYVTRIQVAAVPSLQNFIGKLDFFHPMIDGTNIRDCRRSWSPSHHFSRSRASLSSRNSESALRLVTASRTVSSSCNKTTPPSEHVLQPAPLEARPCICKEKVLHRANWRRCLKGSTGFCQAPPNFLRSIASISFSILPFNSCGTRLFQLEIKPKAREMEIVPQGEEVHPHLQDCKTFSKLFKRTAVKNWGT